MSTIVKDEIAALFGDRALAHDDERGVWLAARRGVVTATEAKVLVKAAPATKAKLLREKVSGTSTFKGNQATEWGTRREPEILRWAASLGFIPAGWLIKAETGVGAATPDAWRLGWAGLELMEVKTSRNDVAPGTAAFKNAGYFYQMQWQMWCTGADRVLYVWEQHDDDFSGWPERGPAPLHDEPLSEWVDRDDVVIAEMVAASERFWSRLEKATAAAIDGELNPVEDTPAERELAAFLDEQAAMYAGAMEAEKQAAASKKDIAAVVAARLGAREWSERGKSGILLTFSPPETVETVTMVPDDEAAIEADPDGWAKVVAARDAESMATVARVAAEDQWAVALANGPKKQVTTTKTSKATMRVTPPKGTN